MDRYVDNIDGRFYVTHDCIACDTCVGLAKDYFTLTSNCDYAYAYRQPESDVTIKQCQKALHSCPVAAIKEVAVL